MVITSELIDLLQENRFVALVGASASGKTSLIQSGIIPALLMQEKEEWVPVSVRPGNKTGGESDQGLSEGISQ